MPWRPGLGDGVFAVGIGLERGRAVESELVDIRGEVVVAGHELAKGDELAAVREHAYPMSQVPWRCRLT